MRVSAAKRIPCLVLGVFVALLLAASLAGCVAPGKSQDAESERIAKLERELEQLKKSEGQGQGQGTDTGAQPEGSTPPAPTPEAPADPPAADPPAAAPYSDTVAQGFAERADELIARARAAQPPADWSQRVGAFLDLDSEFEALEREIDLYDDQKEREHRSGQLAWEDYRAIELELDRIEDGLDFEQDALELRFGVDD